VELIETIGDFAGLAAFIGLGILALLFFAQSRDLRRLREWAGAAPERDAELAEATAGIAEQRSEELQRLQDEQRRREEAVAAERAANDLRERRRDRRERGLPEQTRWERIRERVTGDSTGDGFGRRAAVIVIAIIVIAVGVAAVATDFFSGSDDGGSKSVLDPSSIQVAVLNGTDVEGLAGRFGDQIDERGYSLGAITNSPMTFEQSVVMFRPGFKPEAQRVARELNIREVRPMGNAIAEAGASAKIAVIVGEDKTAAGTG
jgi:hypothetical protein